MSNFTLDLEATIPNPVNERAESLGQSVAIDFDHSLNGGIRENECMDSPGSTYYTPPTSLTLPGSPKVSDSGSNREQYEKECESVQIELKATMAAWKRENDNLREALAAQSAKNNDLFKALDEKEKELKESRRDLGRKLLEKDENIAALERSNKELKRSGEQREKDLVQKRAYIANLEESNKVLRESKEELEAKLLKKQENILILEKSNKELEQLKRELRKDLSEKKRCIADLEESKKELRAKLEEMEVKLEKKRRDMIINFGESNERIMIIGGQSRDERKSIGSVVALDLQTRELTALSSLPQPRCQFGAGILNDRVYVVGGATEKSCFLRTVLSYDINEDRWISAAPLSAERLNFNVAILDNLIVAVGGYSVPANKSVEALDPRQDGWMILPSITTPRWGHVVVCADGLIYAVGGYNSEDKELQSVEVYDHKAGRWSAGPSLPSPRAFAGGAVLGSRVILVGGEEGHNVLATTEMLYNDQWGPLPEMPAPRFTHSAATIGSTIYAIGGRSETDLYHSVLSLNMRPVISGSSQPWSTLGVFTDVPRIYAGAVPIPK